MASMIQRVRNAFGIERAARPSKLTPDGPRLFVNLQDYVIGVQTVLGIYEQEEIALVQRLVQPGHHVIDIGANIGVFTVTLAQSVGATGRVYAFEPIPHLAALLFRSIAENHFDWVTLEQAALSAERGSVELLQILGGPNQGGSYIVPEKSAPPEGHQIVNAPTYRLDDYPCERPIHFIKMDVEGAEPIAMRGAATLLQHDHPLILSEICPPQLDRVSHTNATAFIGEMATLGYVCYLCGGESKGAQITEYTSDEIINVLFVPRNRPSPL